MAMIMTNTSQCLVEQFPKFTLTQHEFPRLFRQHDNITTKLSALKNLTINLSHRNMAEASRWISTAKIIQSMNSCQNNYGIPEPDHRVTHLRRAPCSILEVSRGSAAVRMIQAVLPYLSVENAAVVLREKSGILRHGVGEANFAPPMFMCSSLVKDEVEGRKSNSHVISSLNPTQRTTGSQMLRKLPFSALRRSWEKKSPMIFSEFPFICFASCQVRLTLTQRCLALLLRRLSHNVS